MTDNVTVTEEVTNVQIAQVPATNLIVTENAPLNIDVTTPGPQGATGPAPTLKTPTTTTGAAGSSASVSITGDAVEGYTLGFIIPRGANGATGPAPTLSTPTVTALAVGAQPTVGITGSNPYTINFGIPQSAVWTSGATPTSTSPGNVGDYYLVTSGTDVGDVYKKTAASTWTKQGNIRGAAGQGNVDSVNGVLPDVNGNVVLPVVDLSSAQTISGAKTFLGNAIFGDATVGGTPLTVKSNSSGTAQQSIVTNGSTGKAILELGSTATGTADRLWQVHVGGGNVSGLNGGATSEGTFIIKEAGTDRIRIDRGGQFNVLGTMSAISFTGDGSLLTNLNASNIGTGTLSDGRLPARLQPEAVGVFNAGATASNITFFRIATLNGQNDTGGANLTGVIGNSGNYGSATRALLFFTVSQRGSNVASGKCWMLNDASTTVGTLYLKQVSTYDFELWIKREAYDSSFGLHVWGSQRATINMDAETTIDPGGLVEVPIVDIQGPVSDDRLPGRLAGAQVADWNETTESGFYWGPASALNSPNSAAAFNGLVVARDPAQYVVQYAWNNDTDDDTYVRKMVAGAWGSWAKMPVSQASLDALYAPTRPEASGIIFDGGFYYGERGKSLSFNRSNAGEGIVSGGRNGSDCFRMSRAGYQYPGVLYPAEFIEGHTYRANIWIRVPTTASASQSVYVRNNIHNSAGANAWQSVTFTTPNDGVWHRYEHIFTIPTDSTALDSNYWVQHNGTSTAADYIEIDRVDIWDITDIQDASRITTGTLSDARLSSNVVLLNSTQTISGIKSFSGGSLNLTNPTSNFINFPANGVGAPTTTTRSAGTKIVLYPLLSSTRPDTAIGVETGAMWFAVGPTTDQFKWYGGTTLAATLTGGGDLTTVGSITSSGATVSKTTAATLAVTTTTTGGYSTISTNNSADGVKASIATLAGAVRIGAETNHPVNFITNNSVVATLAVDGSLNTTGSMTATSFSGSGASLTGLTSSQVGLENVPNLTGDQMSLTKATVSGLVDGWVRIATQASGKGAARFHVWDSTSGVHNSVIFEVTSSYNNVGGGSDPQINVLSSTRYGSSVSITGIRLARDTSNFSNVVYLEVQIAGITGITVSMTSNTGDHPWSLVTPVASTLTAGYTTFDTVTLDGNPGFITTGKIVAPNIYLTDSNGTSVINTKVSVGTQQAGPILSINQKGSTYASTEAAITANTENSNGNSNYLFRGRLNGTSVFSVRADGLVAATSFSGSGASLTGLTKSQVGLGNVINEQQATAVGGGKEKVAAATGTSGAVTLDASVASVFTLTPTADVTSLAVTNAPAGVACTLTLVISQGATVRAIATPTGGIWLGGAPTQVANKKCVITLMSTDGGTSWICSGAVQA